MVGKVTRGYGRDFWLMVFALWLTTATAGIVAGLSANSLTIMELFYG